MFFDPEVFGKSSFFEENDHSVFVENDVLVQCHLSTPSVFKEHYVLGRTLHCIEHAALVRILSNVTVYQTQPTVYNLQ